MTFHILTLILSAFSAFWLQEYFLNTHSDQDMITRITFSLLVWITCQGLIVLIIWLLHLPIVIGSLLVSNLILFAAVFSFKYISFSHDKR